ncbi:hypothetical protein WJ542_03370 [Paraburkholderia sp. B3]|uniref:hypothetical protein n=1 Tax=Paraburkholderia sp. B3 TaxID=3134791 RepID=UPI0039822F6A
MHQNFKKFVLIACITALLSACGKGVDRKLNTSGTDDDFKASLNTASGEMSDKDKQAYNWAVSDLTIADIRQRYPNKTLRDIIHGEAKLVSDTYPTQISALQAKIPQYDATLHQITKIQATDTSFHLAKDFFGLQPKVETTIHNNSSLPVSALSWHAKLYINGNDTPIAESDLSDRYENGLAPNQTVNREFTVGFVSGDTAWTTLDIQNAKITKVVLTPNPDSVEDFSNHEYMDGAPYNQLSRDKATLDAAKEYISY